MEQKMPISDPSAQDTTSVFKDFNSTAIADENRVAIAWLSNFRIYAEDLLRIQDIEGNLVPFTLNNIQTILLAMIEDMKASGRLVRAVILKARREGVSTMTAGRFYWKTTTQPNRYAMMVTHEPQATDFLFAMHKRFHVHNVWKPQDRYNNRKILEFNDPKGQGLDSAIRVATAGKEDVGSSQLIHYLHLSEVAKWPAHTAGPLLTSVLQCVPRTEDSEVIFESTAKGIGGEFYERFYSCRYGYEVYLDEAHRPAFRCVVNSNASPENEYSSVFFPWFAFDKYVMEPEPGFTPTDEERELSALHNLTHRHLAWRRWAIANLCDGDLDAFHQEYPSSPQEAFLSTGRPVFDTNLLLALMKVAPEPIARYDLMPSTGQWISRADGQLLVWDEPTAGGSYAISADVAEGLEHGDWSVADVIDQLTGNQVAHFHGHLEPDLFAVLLYHLHRRYNQAWLVPERNNHGQTVVLKLLELGVTKLYVERIPDPPNKPRKRYGWLTSTKSKPPIIDNLVAEIRDGTHGIRCRDTLQEMLSFKRGPRGEMEAETGMCDDRVMCYAIGKFVRRTLPTPAGIMRRPQSDVFVVGHRQVAPPGSGWM